MAYFSESSVNLLGIDVALYQAAGGLPLPFQSSGSFVFRKESSFGILPGVLSSERLIETSDISHF